MSSQEQANEGESLRAQAQKLGAYCKLHDLEVTHELVEPGVSATKKPLSRRPEGRKLLELVRARRVRHVVVWALDRAFRNAAECLTVVESWTKRGVSLHLMNFGGQTIDTSTATGKMFLTMLAGFAEYESNLKGERVALALRHKQARNEYLGGEPRYGWRVVGRDPAVQASGHLVKDEAEQRVIARVRELRAAGQGSRRIAAALAREGVLSRRGRPFAAVQIERMWA